MRCVEAFNARDLEGMLACLSKDVEFHPLRLGGLCACYRGHDGVREWFANLTRSRYDHRIAVSETRDLGRGRVLASGSLWLGEQREIETVCAVERINHGLIVATDHYLTDTTMIERLGLIRDCG